MITFNHLIARAGEKILPKWMALTKALESLVVIAGHGVRVLRTPYGQIVSVDSGASWAHPFRPTLRGDEVVLEKGFVETFEPTIDGVAISGDPENGIPQPGLKLDAALVGKKTGMSWIAIEAEANKQGNFTADKDGAIAEGQRLEIVHTASLEAKKVVNPAKGSGGEVGVQPLALIVWTGGTPSSITPIVHHNLRYERTFPTSTPAIVKHFFWAV